MQEVRSSAQEYAEDIFFGQVVMSWARWFIIAAGVVLALWASADAAKLVIGVVPVVALMAMNFYLHGRYLAGRPANRVLITAASVLDLAIITLVVIFEGQFFILYYPVVLAFAFVMPPRLTAVYTTAALAAYAGAYLLADPALMNDMDAVKTLVTRLITLGAMGALGTYYWRIQRQRRRAVVGGAAEDPGHPLASQSVQQYSWRRGSPEGENPPLVGVWGYPPA